MYVVWCVCVCEGERESESASEPMPLLFPLFPSLMAGAAASREPMLPLSWCAGRRRGMERRVCVCARARVFVFVCVCERERERDGWMGRSAPVSALILPAAMQEPVCLHVCACVCVCVCGQRERERERERDREREREIE